MTTMEERVRALGPAWVQACDEVGRPPSYIVNEFETPALQWLFPLDGKENALLLHYRSTALAKNTSPLWILQLKFASVHQIQLSGKTLQSLLEKKDQRCDLYTATAALLKEWDLTPRTNEENDADCI